MVVRAKLIKQLKAKGIKGKGHGEHTGTQPDPTNNSKSQTFKTPNKPNNSD